jgi:hypothetical protein
LLGLVGADMPEETGKGEGVETGKNETAAAAYQRK